MIETNDLYKEILLIRSAVAPLHSITNGIINKNKLSL